MGTYGSKRLIRTILLFIQTGCSFSYSMTHPTQVSYMATPQPKVSNRTDCENLCSMSGRSCVSYQLDSNI